MRFSVPALVTLTMSASLASAVNLPSTACWNLPSVIQGVDVERFFGHAQQEICNKGCKVKLSEYEPNLRNFAISIIEAETPNMGTPQLNNAYISGVDSIIDMARTQCADGEGDLCTMNTAELQSLAKCVKANAWRVLLDNALSLWPVLTTNCQTQYDFFSNPALWKEKVPTYFREFAKNCAKN
ncbi:uncharacterized protein NFIA_034110 [Aspergillus fischeri NRRL 181]|uniref:Uncharacterized protein n=1 Tax=Neosartorya fischeri (strain ATCC 1020 / DSM 3700 / CBS 544.65 / FGSC A1164 / JCM 1740 / NRRL 181 / WB 181) TaxID=331117 RepID=A1CYM5_NEOFI|nr:uncharacterized protein NFIA_034110 [Aspergillus fischeri NRRL 181]EAW23845.1 hypothetical protein NFIA_034110 [Aspergillus fischeri NRRL 181]KAG2026736.1 hypothetical protein GB937_001524 [Aspergillus fischeri]